MLTFFNNIMSNPIYKIATAATLAMGNLIWLISAANAIGPSDRAVLTCFHHYNITDANLGPTEECSDSFNGGGRGAHRSCGIVEVYDQYTIDHCGAEMQHSMDAKSSEANAVLIMVCGLALAVAYACSQTVGAKAIQTKLTELMPMKTDQGSNASSSLSTSSGSTSYSTFAATTVPIEEEENNSQVYTV
jgi:hypothetical protein